MVYLDLTHKSKEFLQDRLGGILDIYTKFTGDDPKVTPMKIFPAVHYSMGGLWTDYETDAEGNDRSKIPAQSNDFHSGTVRGWRGGLPLPRSQPPGGQFSPQLYLYRD